MSVDGVENATDGCLTVFMQRHETCSMVLIKTSSEGIYERKAMASFASTHHVHS